jgi:hypothetical protein
MSMSVAIISRAVWKSLNKSGFHAQPAATTSLRNFVNSHFQTSDIVCEKYIIKRVSSQLNTRCRVFDASDENMSQYAIVIVVLKLERGVNYIVASVYNKRQHH